MSAGAWPEFVGVGRQLMSPGQRSLRAKGRPDCLELPLRSTHRRGAARYGPVLKRE